MFIAEILSIDADEKYIDKNGAFDISKCDLIAYANGGYYPLDDKIGKFGFSVEKKKKDGKKLKTQLTKKSKNDKINKPRR